MGMALDLRLACLMAVINKNWAELEAKESDGALVIRVKGKAPEAEKPEKCGRLV